MRFALIAAIALGCTAPPEKTCEALIKLRRADAASRNKPLTPEKEAQLQGKCVADMREMEERDHDAYVCAADCVGRVNDLDLASTCVSLCDYKKNTKPAPSSSLVPATP
ncbi:MAG: hypothetical protein ACXVEF_02360 [Polyangiales bacterium]